MTSIKTLKDLAAPITIANCPGAVPLYRVVGDDWRETANNYRVTLTYKGKRLTVDFFQGTGIADDPTALSVLECLLSDAQSVEESFKDWCRSFGYEEDSRKALKTYKACEATAAKLQRLLGDEYETFLSAERD